MIYELLAKKESPTDKGGRAEGEGGFVSGSSIDRTKYLRYEEALSLYFEGKYLEAGQLFEKNMTDDAPSRVMAMRCVDIIT